MKHDVIRSCPTCWGNLFYQEGTQVWHIAQDRLWLYRCGECGQYSKWDPSPPAPIYLGPPTYRDLLDSSRR
jgi:hypothetical protein